MSAPTYSPARVLHARLAAGHTQTEAAALIYRTLRGWQDWESGARTVDPAAFELYLRKTGVNDLATPSLNLRDARAYPVSEEASDSGCPLYRVAAFCDLFGGDLIVAEFPFDAECKPRGKYGQRAKAMAAALVEVINSAPK